MSEKLSQTKQNDKSLGSGNRRIQDHIADRMTVDLDIPHSAEERARATRVLTVPEQIERAIRFQREIIKAAEAEIARLQNIRV